MTSDPTMVIAASADAAAPVEYAVAVDRYLAGATLGPASRRIYRISLTSWSWPLVGRTTPPAPLRRGARPPVVPLAVLDDDDAAAKLGAAMIARERCSDARTVNRELSALRSAIGWWQDRRWIASDPTTRLRHLATGSAALPALTDRQLSSLWRSSASLREHALWHLLHDSGAPVDAVLALDASGVDRASGRAMTGRDADTLISWSEQTAALVDWLLAGRRLGPVFLTNRRAPATARASDVCPLSGRARMSYRRAAEVFTSHTRQLDPAGHGWTLHQLRQAEAGDSHPGPA